MTEAERGRECGCPDWVEPCAHFDGQILHLSDRHSAAYRHTHLGTARYCVGLGSTPWKPCMTCNEDLQRIALDVAEEFAELAMARAEFDRREAQLLGRDA